MGRGSVWGWWAVRYFGGGYKNEDGLQIMSTLRDNIYNPSLLLLCFLLFPCYLINPLQSVCF